MKNDYLIEKKDNIITKMINFFRNIFYKERDSKTDINDVENDDKVENIKEIETQENIEENVSQRETEFLNYIRVNKKEDPELIELQKKFENKEILMSELSDEELINLNELYQRQIDNMKRELENKKTKIGMLKFKLSRQLLNKNNM